MKHIILASASPRRRELLETMGITDFTVRPAVGQEQVPEGAGPEATVCAVSLQKLREVAAAAEDGDIVIAADTLVFLDGEALGKPKNTSDARRMLKALSGRSHRVCTGVAVWYRGRELVQAVSTDVTFRKMTDSEIESYIATGEPMDKAGAYGIQGLGSIYIEGICGDYFNVMGLPVCTLHTMLERITADKESTRE